MFTCCLIWETTGWLSAFTLFEQLRAGWTFAFVEEGGGKSRLMSTHKIDRTLSSSNHICKSGFIRLLRHLLPPTMSVQQANINSSDICSTSDISSIS